ncbi:unnamed protein product [Mycena citricolor]|uniref:Transmembrane protein n=1 Tax=Mycena citricolor TaxID=2018698 RepID=A0AAD2HQM1_9AGAR|nr:unnamed protein product [Mycena citricolor]
MSAIFTSALFWLAVDLLLAVANGQTTNATCQAGHNWAFNSQKQSPCLVAAQLIAVCSPAYEVYALPDSYHYEGPSGTDANPCQCNTVVYSLLAECGLCQGRSISQLSPVTDGVFGRSTAHRLPQHSLNPFRLVCMFLVGPFWTFRRATWLTSDSFNELNALNSANLTESTMIPLPSSTLGTGTSASPTPTSAALENSANAMQRHANAVGGGVLGGVAALLLVAGVSFWIRHRKQRLARQGQVLRSPVMAERTTGALTNTLDVPSITVSSMHQASSSSSLPSASAV